jgi:hypothetical protein
MSQYEAVTDAPEGVVIDPPALATSPSSQSVGSDLDLSLPPPAAETIPLFIDDDDVPFDPDYPSYLAKVRDFEAAHDFTDLRVLSVLPDENPDRSVRPPPIPDGPLPDISAIFQPPSPLILLKNELDLIFLNEDFPEKVLVPPKLIDKNIPTLPNSPHEPVLPKNAMFRTNHMVVEARLPKQEKPARERGAIERSASQGQARARRAPRSSSVPQVNPPV